jgi:hypothetical protein
LVHVPSFARSDGPAKYPRLEHDPEKLQSFFRLNPISL